MAFILIDQKHTISSWITKHASRYIFSIFHCAEKVWTMNMQPCSERNKLSITKLLLEMLAAWLFLPLVPSELWVTYASKHASSEVKWKPYLLLCILVSCYSPSLYDPLPGFSIRSIRVMALYGSVFELKKAMKCSPPLFYGIGHSGQNSTCCWERQEVSWCTECFQGFQ